MKTERLALDAFDVKVYAARDNVNIQGVIPVNLVTTGQTSGYQLFWTKSFSTGQGQTLVIALKTAYISSEDGRGKSTSYQNVLH